MQATDLPTELNRKVDVPSRAEDKRSEETVQATDSEDKVLGTNLGTKPDLTRGVKASDPDDFSTVRLRGGRGRRDREEYNMGSHWSDDSDDRGCCCEVM